MELDQEEWKDIAGYEGLYQVSSLGRIKRINAYRQMHSNRIIADTKRQYCQVRLSKNNEKQTLLVHRLVATAFVDNPDHKEEVNHINGDRYDNRAVNLEWNTRKENLLHAKTTGLLESNFASHRKPVYCIDSDGKGLLFNSLKDAVAYTGIDKKTLSQHAKSNEMKKEFRFSYSPFEGGEIEYQLINTAN
jgi:hypothetical protein